MRIKSVKLENILSLEKVDLVFENNGLTLLEGHNFDTGSANGSGKSSIFTGICWTLFDNFPRKISISELVRRGSKNSYGEIIVSVDKQDIKVIRKRPGGVLITINDENITEDQFKKLIKLDYDQFILTQYFHQGGSSRFLDLNDSGRKELILKLMSATKFNDIKLKLDSKIKSILQEIIQHESKMESIVSKIETMNSFLEDNQLLEQLILSNSSKIKEVNDLINVNKPPLLPDTSKYDDLLTKLDNHLKIVYSSFSEFSQINKQIQKMNQFETHHHHKPDYICPVCLSELTVSNNKLLPYSKESIEDKQKTLLEENEKQKLELSNRLLELQKIIDQEDKIKDNIDRCRLKIKESTQEYTESLNYYNELLRIKDKVISKSEDLNNRKIKQIEIKSRIDSSKTLLKEEKEYLKIKQIELEKYQVASQVVSPTGTPAYIMDSVIDLFNHLILGYLSLIWSNATYELLTHKENKSGSVVAKMSDSLIINGEKVSIGSLSGGEKTCLSIAIDFALIEIVSQYTGLDLNPIILDEPMDFLDEVNQELVMSLLQELSVNRHLIIVSHSSKVKGLFDRTITVEKRSGISVIK